MSNFTATSTTEFEVNEQAVGRVLIIDDDTKLCDLLTQYLVRRHFVVENARDGVQGLQQVWNSQYDLIVLDVMLPGVDGFEVLRRIRGGNGPTAHIPILMLTAHNDDVDRIVGLELGADDYLTKPFNPRELLARIRTIMRRSSLTSALSQPPILLQEKPEQNEESTSESATPKNLQVDDIKVNYGTRTVTRNEENLKLTATEFELLTMLLNASQIVTREEIARDVLHRELLPFDRSLDMHISKLRRKLGPSTSGAERIQTVRSIGYIYMRETES